MRLDLRNAYNEVDRAVLLQRVAAVPELRPLARFFHTMHAGESALYLFGRGRAFLISRSVLGPAPQRWRAGGGKQKQKTENRRGGGPGARHEKSKKYPLGP